MANITIKFNYKDSPHRDYKGICFNEDGAKALLSNQVKNKLLDQPQRDELLNYFKTLEQDTGFQKSKTLLIDIQSLQNQKVDVQNFRIGEAVAEVILEENFSCRFYWNELRDARNPKGNKTGADLVGFIEIEGNVLFLFGEVKTSSEQKSPPLVMTNPDGIENQLKDLYIDQQKRRILISYIKSKIGLVDSERFKQDFDNAIKNYYRQNSKNYLLYGVLVRDTNPDENDIKLSYEKLKAEILEPTGLKLLAIYLPISKEKWLTVINGEQNETN